MKTLKIVLSILVVTLLATPNILAEEKVSGDDNEAGQKTVKLADPAQFQKVIDEYKEYVAKIPAEIREEVISYRTDIAKINKEKKSLYNKLSSPAQEYLKKEQQYKKKLPLKRKELINLQSAAPQTDKK